jgi:large subunit ribosomal protein L24
MQAIKSVTKPAKQRKMLFQAPDHVRYRLFAAPLSPELRASHMVKVLQVRSGDTVRIMRGDHKGFEGKITRIDRKKYRIYVEGLTREKVDGTPMFVPIHPSKVMITRLNLDDKWRKKVLERKKEALRTVEEVVAEKPLEEVVKEKEAEKEKTPEKKSRRKKKVAEKPAEKKKEEKPKKRKRVKKEKLKPKKAEEERQKAKKTRARSKTAKKAEGGT